MANIWKVPDYPEDNVPIMNKITVEDMKEEFLDNISTAVIMQDNTTFVLRRDWIEGLDDYIHGFYSIISDAILNGLKVDFDELIDKTLEEYDKILVFDNEDTLFRWALDQKEE